MQHITHGLVAGASHVRTQHGAGGWRGLSLPWAAQGEHALVSAASALLPIKGENVEEWLAWVSGSGSKLCAEAR